MGERGRGAGGAAGAPVGAPGGRQLTCWSSLGKSLLIDFATSRKSLNSLVARRRDVYAESEPAGAVPAAVGVPVGSDTWPLSL